MEPQEPSSQNTWENQHFRAATTIEGTIEAEKPVRPTEPKNRSNQNPCANHAFRAATVFERTIVFEQPDYQMETHPLSSHGQPRELNTPSSHARR